MKVSVVMATYNGESFLIEQLDSLRKQTRTIDEIIICDDVSKDSTVEIIEKYIAQYHLENSWKLYRNAKNLGYADNFAQGLRIACGDYIFFADQDDVWLANKIEDTVRVMEANPKIQLLCSDFAPLVSSEDAPEIQKHVLDAMKDDGSLEKIPLNHRNIFIGSLGCVMCIRAGFRDQIEKYWFSGWAHDEYVWKLAQCMDGCYRYHKVLIQRRLHDHNVSMHKFHDMEKRIQFLALLQKSHEQTLQCAVEQGRSKADIRLIQKNIQSVQLRLSLLKNQNLWLVWKTFFYFPYYHSMKSLIMEPYMVLRERLKRG